MVIDLILLLVTFAALYWYKNTKRRIFFLALVVGIVLFTRFNFTIYLPILLFSIIFFSYWKHEKLYLFDELCYSFIIASLISYGIYLQKSYLLPVSNVMLLISWQTSNYIMAALLCQNILQGNRLMIPRICFAPLLILAVLILFILSLVNYLMLHEHSMIIMILAQVELSSAIMKNADFFHLLGGGSFLLGILHAFFVSMKITYFGISSQNIRVLLFLILLLLGLLLNSLFTVVLAGFLLGYSTIISYQLYKRQGKKWVSIKR